MDAAAWDAELRAKAEAARARAADLLADAGCWNATVTTGHAAQTLLRTAETFDADLIAVGAHGHSRVAAILLGSVAARVIREAPCSVLVARGNDAPIVVEGEDARAERLAQKAESSVLIVRGAREPDRAEPPGPAPRATAGRS
jgi:nucleotide-binding universal stress UspA family protein